MQVTADTLKELGAGDIPQIIVYNKVDKCGMEPLPQKRQDNWYLAAGQNIGIRELAQILSREYREDGILIHADCHRQDMDRYREYIVL